MFVQPLYEKIKKGLNRKEHSHCKSDAKTKELLVEFSVVMVEICLVEEVCDLTVISSKKCDGKFRAHGLLRVDMRSDCCLLLSGGAKHSRWDRQTTVQRPHGGEKLHHCVQTKNQDVCPTSELLAHSENTGQLFLQLLWNSFVFFFLECFLAHFFARFVFSRDGFHCES